MSGNDTQPVFPPVELLNQYTIGFEGNALGSILYGSIYIVIAGANLILLRKKRFRFLLFFTVFQLVLSTLYTAISLFSGPAQLLAIFGLFGVDGPDALSPWNAVVVDAAFVLNTWASDAFLLYRCYIVCMGSKPMVALPALIYLATVGASLAWLIVSSVPGAVYSTHTVQVAGIASFSCSVAMNVTASILITICLLMHRRAISQAVGSQQGRFYLSYLAMTLESAVLYTVFVIITLIVFTINSPLVNIFFPVLGNIQVIAPAIIIYRIGRGISFETDQYGKDSTEGTLRFASGPLRRQVGHTPGHNFSDASKTMQFSSGGSMKSARDGSNSFTNELKEEHV